MTPAEKLAEDIARETYDRFMMGGWEPSDMIPELLEMIAEYEISKEAA